MRKIIQDVELAVNERKKIFFDRLNERGKNYSSKKFEHKDECIEDSEEADKTIQKNQLIDLKQHLEICKNFTCKKLVKKLLKMFHH